MHVADVKILLGSLRAQALAAGTANFRSHQLDAHWSLAFACEKSPEPWEMYNAPNIRSLPLTEFFLTHPEEIQDALKPHATFDFLSKRALASMSLEDEMTEAERTAFGQPGNLQYYDFARNVWLSVDVRRIQWFDGRDGLRETMARSKDEYRMLVEITIERLRKTAQNNPTPRNIEELDTHERFVRSEQFHINLQRFELNKSITTSYLSKLVATPELTKILYKLLREAENEVRTARGIARIGEAWVSETELLYRVRSLFANVEIIAHGQPKWLGRQHLDIWIPALSVGIEYHGVQHFRPVGFFGGDEAFYRTKERDNRKRILCEKNDIRLVEIAYDQDIDDEALKLLLVPQVPNPDVSAAAL